MDCNDSLRATISAHLSGFAVKAADRGQARAAAVAVTVTDAGLGADFGGLPRHPAPHPGAALILTRRSLKLRSHPGQWALPGGRIDPGETPEQTALREMREEVGLDLPEQAIIGRLDDFVTRSGFIMTPVVIWAGVQHGFTPNADEVESIHRIPVTEFLREDAPMLAHEGQGSEPVLRMPVGDNWIAAPTAAILYQFREVCLLGRPVRVAHYEQPGFAWR